LKKENEFLKKELRRLSEQCVKHEEYIAMIEREYASKMKAVLKELKELNELKKILGRRERERYKGELKGFEE